MEDKLFQLKEEWCKWKCSDSNKSRDIDIESHCPVCNDEPELITEEIRLCDYCQIENFVTFVRNEIGGK